MPKPPTCRRCNTAHWTTQVCPAGKVPKSIDRPAKIVIDPKPKRDPARETAVMQERFDMASRLAELEAKDSTRRRRKADAMKRWRDGVKKRKTT